MGFLDCVEAVISCCCVAISGKPVLLKKGVVSWKLTVLVSSGDGVLIFHEYTYNCKTLNEKSRENSSQPATPGGRVKYKKELMHRPALFSLSEVITILHRTEKTHEDQECVSRRCLGQNLVINIS